MKRIAIFMATVAVLSVEGFAQTSVTSSAPSAVQALGITEDKPITNGYVFVDGEYVEPPYVVI
jgi:hypothetical protein